MMNKCQNCGNDNLDTSRFCDECGTRLIEAVEQLSAPPLYVPPAITDVPPMRPVSVTSIGIPPVGSDVQVVEAQAQSAPVSQNGTMNAKLIVERGDSPGVEFRLSGTEATIGRWDADNGIFPDVDLDAHDTEAKVSRRHARIKMQEGKYYVEDLGSTNGTYVNRGRRLLPGNSHLLNDGDEVIVGKTFMRFHIVA
jgi:FHA domain/zinc-ribbon domain